MSESIYIAAAVVGILIITSSWLFLRSHKARSPNDEAGGVAALQRQIERRTAMALEVGKDNEGNKKIEWCQGADSRGLHHRKRVYIQHRNGEADWAGTGRYLVVSKMNVAGTGPVQGPDFPIESARSDEEVLLAIVSALNEITGGSPCEDHP